MLFSGKRFRRVRCENLDEMLSATQANEHIVRVLKSKAPIVTFTIKDEDIHLHLDINGKHATYSFKFGKEQEMERIDGGKVKITYTREGNNILNQVIKMPDGKTAYFRREIKGDYVEMLVKMEGSDLTATIYYEVVD
ncbi:fatty acid-binding protein type 3-like [Nymphalis io]|uniref:fatty acid-binding protein type 3-like n=1 Tax=Inachis io TaxID=171585 RepID=UPI0021692BD6|nr:fatty acid-binding protein type 3-like [Nymphalis io]